MKNWFEIKVRYEKMHENGIERMTTESYLLDAYSFTEAESRGVEELTPYMSGEFTLTAVTKKKYAETFFGDKGGYYYEAILAFITLDEKSGKEKETTVRMLIQENTVSDAIEKVKEEMEKSMVDYRIKSVKETAILDVFIYSKE